MVGDVPLRTYDLAVDHRVPVEEESPAYGRGLTAVACDLQTRHHPLSRCRQTRARTGHSPQDIWRTLGRSVLAR